MRTSTSRRSPTSRQLARASASPGRATGQNLLEWPLGRSSASATAIRARWRVAPPPGVELMTASLAALRRAADPNHVRHEWGPFAPMPLAAHVPIAGEVTYRFEPDRVDVERRPFATERTHVSFDGTTAWGDPTPRSSSTSRAATGRRATQVLAGILTDFGSPHRTGAVRRARRVRRRDDRPVPAAAGRRACSPARTCAPGTRLWGDGSAAHRRREQLRDGDRRHHPRTTTRRFAPTAVLARLSAPRRRRGDRRALPRRRGAISTACATRSRSTTIRCRAS